MYEKSRNSRPLPSQNWEQNVSTTPIGHSRTLRTQLIRNLSSVKPGTYHPLAFIPLLREDSIRTSTVRIAFDMQETADLLMNPVRVVVKAHFCPKLALERFSGMDDITQSWMGTPGAPVWFRSAGTASGATPGTDTIMRAAGIHPTPGQLFNLEYIEVYNQIWNHEAKNRSSDLTLRADNNLNLGEAFWPQTAFKHIKPTFDQALIDGEVPLNVTGQDLPVYATNSGSPYLSSVENVMAGGPGDNPSADASRLHLNNNRTTSEVWAELQDNGITVSLSNIDMARKTAAWARLRTQYQGLSEDALMDVLLSGVSIPDEYLRHPILVDRSETVFGLEQRYATDAGNLDVSASRGMAVAELRLSLPRMTTGGVMMLSAEILPEQINERIEDPYLQAMSVEALPNRTRDELDPEPVSVVKNRYVDVDHGTPDDVFGYAPLNHQWQIDAPRIGGKFFRKMGDAFSQDRNRIWTPEVIDPVLGENFYISKDLEWPVFNDQASDPFEVNVLGVAAIEGLTYFGPALREATGDYEAVRAQVPDDRIEQV